MRRLLFGLALALCAYTPCAWADWAVGGAAYRCDAGRGFELRATVETSNPDDPATVLPAPGFTAVAADRTTRLRCRVGGNKVDAVITVTGPLSTGMCAGSGNVSIRSLRVDGKAVVLHDAPFAMACDGGPAIVSVRIERRSAQVCRGAWDGGRGFHDVRCDPSLASPAPARTDCAKAASDISTARTDARARDRQFVDSVEIAGRLWRYRGVDLDGDGVPDLLEQSCGSPSDGSCSLHFEGSRGGSFDFEESVFHVRQLESGFYVLVRPSSTDSAVGEHRLYRLSDTRPTLACTVDLK